MNRETISKAHHLPLTLRSGYSSSEEEEKVKVLIILIFPSFSKEVCHARRIMTGWLKTLLKTAPIGIIPLKTIIL